MSTTTQSNIADEPVIQRDKWQTRRLNELKEAEAKLEGIQDKGCENECDLKSVLSTAKYTAENRARYNNPTWDINPVDAADEARALKLYEGLMFEYDRIFGIEKALQYSYQTVWKVIATSALEAMALDHCDVFINTLYNRGKVGTALHYAHELADLEGDSYKGMRRVKPLSAKPNLSEIIKHEQALKCNVARSKGAALYKLFLDKALEKHPKQAASALQALGSVFQESSYFRNYSGVSTFKAFALNAFAENIHLHEDQNDAILKLKAIAYKAHLGNANQPQIINDCRDVVAGAITKATKVIYEQGDPVKAIEHARSAQYYADRGSQAHTGASHLIVEIAEEYLSQNPQYSLDKFTWALSRSASELPDDDPVKTRTTDLHSRFLVLQNKLKAQELTPGL